MRPPHVTVARPGWAAARRSSARPARARWTPRTGRESGEPMRTVALPLLVVALALLVACGGGGAAPRGAASAPAGGAASASSSAAAGATAAGGTGAQTTTALDAGVAAAAREGVFQFYGPSAVSKPQ